MERKEAIEIVRKNFPDNGFTMLREALKTLIPELAESEDKRMKRLIKTALYNQSDELVEYYRVHNITEEEIFAWLEKQGEQADYNPYKATIESIADMVERYANNGDLKDFYDNIKVKCKDAIEYGKTRIEKQVNSTSEAIKEERVDFPKFHEGDWIIGRATENEPRQIAKIAKDGYKTTYGGWIGSSFEEDIHLWTVEDAKDGDILSYVSDEKNLWIMIYKSLYKPYEGHVHYHALLANDDFSSKGTCCICTDNLKPATKEQRKRLFLKMKEAGYKWDSENKNLYR